MKDIDYSDHPKEEEVVYDFMKDYEKENALSRKERREANEDGSRITSSRGLFGKRRRF